MTDKTITNLTAATSLSGGELVELVQGGNSRKTLLATTAELHSKTDGRLIGADQLWDAAAPVNLGDLTGTVAVDFDDFLGAAYGVATGNITLGVTSNVENGFSFFLQITQDATGTRTIALNATYWVTAGGEALDWDTTASAINVLGCVVLEGGKTLVSVIGKAVA